MKKKYKKLSDKNWLIEQLKIKSTRKIAKEQKCSHSLVMYWVRKFEISIPKRTKYFGWISKEEKIRISKEAYKRKYPNGRFGKDAANWKGGKRIANQFGYIYIYKPEHPKSTKEGYVMEHRLKMEKKLGRYLTDEEIVHHKNGVKNDNRLCNLIVVSRKEHSEKHFGAVKEAYKFKKEVNQFKKEVKRLKTLLTKNNINYV